MNETVSQVKSYFYAHCIGYEKRKHRTEITTLLNIPDRQFRAVCAEIPEIISTHDGGYYILPLVDTTGEETRIARAIIEGEDRRRMIALYLRQRRRRQAIQRLQDRSFGQMDLVDMAK